MGSKPFDEVDREACIHWNVAREWRLSLIQGF